MQVTEVGKEQFDLAVHSIKDEADGIVSIELTAAAGGALPGRTAGAHIEVHLPGGLTRQYSLCNSPFETNRYQIAVLKEPNGRGGSAAMHALQVGDTIHASGPRNNFQLAGSEAVHHLLIAGGIGVTPLLSMVDELEDRSDNFHLHFCAKDVRRAPFLQRLKYLESCGKATLHFDGGEISKGLDLAKMLETPIPAQHVYLCGPPGMMDCARELVGAWAPHTVHFERFAGGPIAMEEDEWEEVPFEVAASKSGKIVQVPARCSIVDALRDAGIEVSVSCEAGFCGACLTRYLEGDPVHRDTVLSRAERKTHTLVCRARSRSPVHVLDI